MNKAYHKTLFVFRQDLRLHDNTALSEAIAQSDQIIPVFIFDETILQHFPAKDKRIGFLVDAIRQLDTQLRKKGSYLIVKYGDPHKLIPQLLQKYEADALFYNKSYGSGSVSRDKAQEDFCKQHNIAHHAYDDFLLVPIDEVPTRKVFTPFFKLRTKALESKDIVLQKQPVKVSSPRVELSKLDTIFAKLSYASNPHWEPDSFTKRIKTFNFSTYEETRNFPAIDGSSKLSPYIRFGLISIRELYNKAREQNAQIYISELAWREFRHHIMHHFPETKLIEFQEKRRNLAWNNNEKLFKARTEGKTGYPIVDAGMRQLREENWMHNRVRMIVASFLTKDLLIDWRRGEKHFANYLIDYDENVNMGNRQRAASVGADPKPLRIFSPIRQSERFDPECIYIKKRLPELQEFSPKQIHNPLENDLKYASPIVDHYERSKRAKEIYNKKRPQ